MSEAIKQDNDIRWICVHTKPNMEVKAAKALEAICLDVYEPLVTADERTDKELKKELVPLYPTYAFCRVKLGDTDLSLIKNTPGIRRIVQFGDEPNQVPDEDIEGLRAKPIRVKSFYERGDRIRMVKRSWSGYEGIVVTCKREKHGKGRVRLLLDQLQHPIWARVQDIEPIT